ncbi:hypothetical protein IKT18_00805 [Candidatus Saccharibacteria bacterium]|nr:hypothetical protein [Candidatus Saccharibacteria bacterium]
MSSKLLVNVNDARPEIVVPDTDAPDTGMFSVSHDDGVSFNTSMVLPIVGIAVLIIAIAAGVIVAIRRHKKVNRFSVHTAKQSAARIATLSLLVLVGLFAIIGSSSRSDKVGALLSANNELTITASDVSFDIDLNDKNVYAAKESVVSIDSATIAGYTLMAYVDSTSTDLTNETNTTSTSTIAMLDSTSASALANNTWGVAVAKPTDQTSTVFTGLPTVAGEAMTIKATTDATSANDSATLYYGTYITPDLDFGTYSGVTITYVAVANFACNPEATNIETAVCFQDFAGPNGEQIIASMTPETEYVLFDMRDEKPYTVAKLLANRIVDPNDPSASTGNYYTVWMTQNLDLDLDSNTTYTNKDTDLGYNPRTGQYTTASWRPERSTTTVAGEWGEVVDGEPCYNADYCGYHTNPQSYDPGDVYWNGTASNGDDWWEYWRACGNQYRPDCHVTIPSSSYISDTGLPNYHIGNFYNWAAAVAANDTRDYLSGYDYALMEQSICPAGWTLPRPGFGEDSFYALWYGRAGRRNDETGAFSNISSLWTEPLAFPVSGYYMGSIGSVGIYGGFWSSAGYSDIAMYGGFNVDGNIFDYNGFGTSYGLSVRCIARPVSPAIFIP